MEFTCGPAVEARMESGTWAAIGRPWVPAASTSVPNTWGLTIS